jgi:hypothetical protein
MSVGVSSYLRISDRNAMLCSLGCARQLAQRVPRTNYPKVWAVTAESVIFRQEAV